jgi:Flp pilus assembly protein TadG
VVVEPDFKAMLRRRFRRFRRDEQGQVLVLAAIGMVAMCGMAGFALDVGVWFQAHRKQQAIADAAALAAAGVLPANTSQATTDAQAYAVKNGGSASSVSFTTQYLADDTITVQATRTVPSYFLKTVGIDSTVVKATAVARAETLGSARGTAPFGIINTQPELAGPGCPCFGGPTVLTVNKVGPGGFGIIDIDGSSGPASPSTLAQWIVNGCNCSTAAPVWLYSDPGARFNSSQVQGAMNQMIGHTLLFPVYDTVQGNGANMQYHVLGFAAFNMTSFSLRGSSGTISGSFVKVDWQGTGTSNTSDYFGATTTRLVG